MYYVRKTDLKSFDAYYFMLVTWSSKPKNTMHEDFDIYSTIDDAIQQKNPWTFCNYDDPNIGFARDCGPTSFTAYNWNSLTHHPMKHYQYRVMKK